GPVRGDECRPLRHDARSRGRLLRNPASLRSEPEDLLLPDELVGILRISVNPLKTWTIAKCPRYTQFAKRTPRVTFERLTESYKTRVEIECAKRICGLNHSCEAEIRAT